MAIIVVVVVVVLLLLLLLLVLLLLLNCLLRGCVTRILLFKVKSGLKSLLRAFI